MPDLVGRVTQYARDHRLFDPPGTAVLAVSGGADSLALLDLFAAEGGVAEQLELELVVAHVDHGIDPASGSVAERVCEMAEHYGVPHQGRALELGVRATETTAREARYDALRSVQTDVGAAFLVTAHHADDQIETVLYRVLRGSAPAGLAGIPIRGRDGLVRPLLFARREELEAWTKERVGWAHDDPANRDTRHDRSWIRTELLPQLRDRFPDVDERILGLGQRAGADRQAWSQVLSAFPDLEFSRTADGVTFAVSPFSDMPPALAIALLRAAAREVGLVVGPSKAARLRDFVAAARSGRSFDIAPGWQVHASFDRVVIAPVDEAGTPDSVRLSPTGETLRWGSWEFTVTEDTAGAPHRKGLETWIEVDGAEVRALEAGDRMRPLGGVGRRKVRRLLMEARVPVSERRRYPVLVQGRHVVWVPGVCRSADAVPRTGAPALRIEARVLDE